MENINIKFKALGTDIQLQLVVDRIDGAKAKNDLLEAKRKYFEFEKMFNRFDNESELSKINDNLGKYQQVSRDMLDVAKRSLEYNHQSEGLFDPRVLKFLNNIGYQKSFHGCDFFKDKKYIESKPLQKTLEESLNIEGEKILLHEKIDFSGIAKGYITDNIANFLISRGWKNFLIDSGGDIFLKGTDENNQPWKIGIEEIADEKLLFSLTDQAIATSGISRRKWEAGNKKVHHIINPKNPNKFDFDVKSVSVISSSAEQSDVWAKILFLMGKEKGMEYSSKNNIASVFLYYNGNARLSKKAKEFIN